MLLWKGAALREGSLLSKLTVWFVLGHLAALGVYGILAIGGFITQYVTRVLIYYGSLALLIYGMTLSSDGIPVAGPAGSASTGAGRPSRGAPAPPLKRLRLLSDSAFCLVPVKSEMGLLQLLPYRDILGAFLFTLSALGTR